MITPAAYFENLLSLVVEGLATEDDFVTFAEIIRQDAVLRQRYMREMRLHALLCCKHQLPDVKNTKSAAYSRQIGRSVWPPRLIAAAAGLLIGLGLWIARSPHAPHNKIQREQENLAAISTQPVQVIRHCSPKGLSLPQALPGTIRLQQGIAVVRLPSGVELTLHGPLELAVESQSGVEARLKQGRLIAWVPPRAKGLTIRTAGLEAWDIGTVFSVSADETGSGILVFKGQVQVMDSSGSAVGLCEAGEGAWAGIDDKTVWKTSLDALDNREAFDALQGYAAIKSPMAAMDLAKKIQTAWVAEFTPKEAWQIRERLNRKAAEQIAAARVPFTKQAWVRPVASVEQEEVNMTKKSLAVWTAATVLMGAGHVGASSQPVSVNTSPTRNGQWSLAHTNAVPLWWTWEAAEARAELTLAGIHTSKKLTFTPPATNWTWQVCAGAVPEVEDVVNVLLRFYNQSDALTRECAVWLTVTPGAFNETAVIPSGTPGRRWARVREGCVISYDAAWSAATAAAPTSRLVIARQDGLTQTNLLQDAAGYYGLKLRNSNWGYGSFLLTLDFPGTEGFWDETLVRTADGFIIILL